MNTSATHQPFKVNLDGAPMTAEEWADVEAQHHKAEALWIARTNRNLVINRTFSWVAITLAVATLAAAAAVDTRWLAGTVIFMIGIAASSIHPDSWPARTAECPQIVQDFADGGLGEVAVSDYGLIAESIKEDPKAADFVRAVLKQGRELKHAELKAIQTRYRKLQVVRNGQSVGEAIRKSLLGADDGQSRTANV